MGEVRTELRDRLAIFYIRIAIDVLLVVGGRAERTCPIFYLISIVIHISHT